MKQGISPAVAVVVILVVIVVVVAIGYFLFLRPKAPGDVESEPIDMTGQEPADMGGTLITNSGEQQPMADEQQTMDMAGGR